jgi:hypothetical protein
MSVTISPLPYKLHGTSTGPTLNFKATRLFTRIRSKTVSSKLKEKAEDFQQDGATPPFRKRVPAALNKKIPSC